MPSPLQVLRLVAPGDVPVAAAGLSSLQLYVARRDVSLGSDNAIVAGR